MAPKILLTGGSGLLGTELRKRITCLAPTRQQLDIVRNPRAANADLIVHCAAYTDVTGAESEVEVAYNTNVIGTRNMARLGLPIIYISTEYVFDGKKGDYKEDDETNPVNWYSMTKLLGEEEARDAPRSLVVRMILKQRPWKYDVAFTDQYTSGDYVDVMAEELIKVINHFYEFDYHDTVHLGTGRKSIYELAKQTRDVKGITRKEVSVALPFDTSLNTAYWGSVCTKLN